MTISWKKWQVVLLCTSTTLQAYTDFYPDKPPETTLSLQSDTYGWCDFVVPTTDTEKNQLKAGLEDVASREHTSADAMMYEVFKEEWIADHIDDGFYEFELSIEAVVEALNRAADVSEDLQNFFIENGVPEKSVIEADEPYMVYGEMNPDIDDGVSMRLQLINPDIDVEIPLYKEECHALSEKIAILDKAEPELPKEDNEKEFVQLEFDFDKE